MYFAEAFKALDCLTEETFSTSREDLKELGKLRDDDSVFDEVDIYDSNATDESGVRESYVGKIILDCCTCHSLFYKNLDEIVFDDEQEVANIDEECPICASVGGYGIVGEVAAFENKSDADTEENSEESETADPDTDTQEPLEEGIFGIKTKKEKAAEAKAKADREAKRKADKEAAEERELARQQAAADSWARHDANKRQAQQDYNRNRYNSIKGDKPSNTGYRGVNYSGGDYYTESVDGDVDHVASEKSRAVNESIKDLSLTTEDTKLEMVADETGKVTVTTEPVIPVEEEKEVIAPLSDEAVQEIEASSTEDDETLEAEDVDIDIDEFDEESFDELGEALLTDRYNNVKSFKTTKVTENSDKLFVEGVIGFKSGKRGKTTFILENATINKNNEVEFRAVNKELNESVELPKIRATLHESKLVFNRFSK